MQPTKAKGAEHVTSRAPVTLHVAIGSAVRLCAKCGRPMAWTLTKNGRRMPVDLHLPIILHASAAPDGSMALSTAEGFSGESHFASCPYADEFRRPR